MEIKAKLKCPLISAPVIQSGLNFAVSGCIGLDCSWYDSIRTQCRLITIEQLLRQLIELVSKKEAA